MKIALVQMQIEWENKQENIKNAERIIEECVVHGAYAVFFPEMSFTGFSMNIDKTYESDSFTLKAMAEIARKTGIIIGYGWVERNGVRCKNKYTIIDKNGSIISSYAKIHPFSYSGEDEKFEGGDEVVTYQIGCVPFSTFICYDLRFPEVFRAVSSMVHAIIVPACWPAKRSEHWKTLLKARAIENQVYIFAVNCQGDIGDNYYSGDSCVVAPDGEVVEHLSNKAGVIIYDFIDDVEEYRNSFPVLKDRRIDLYGQLGREIDRSVSDCRGGQ